MKTIGKIGMVIGLLIVVAFAGVIGKNIGRSTVKNFEQGQLEGAIEEKLIETSRQINKQLPVMVDPETRLDTTMCLGKNLQYKYTMINHSEDDLDKQGFRNEMTAMLAKNQCSNEDVVKTLKIGVEYHYMYFDKNGNHFTTISISKKNCGM